MQCGAGMGKEGGCHDGAPVKAARRCGREEKRRDKKRSLYPVFSLFVSGGAGPLQRVFTRTWSEGKIFYNGERETQAEWAFNGDVFTGRGDAFCKAFRAYPALDMEFKGLVFPALFRHGKLLVKLLLKILARGAFINSQNFLCETTFQGLFTAAPPPLCPFLPLCPQAPLSLRQIPLLPAPCYTHPQPHSV